MYFLAARTALMWVRSARKGQRFEHVSTTWRESDAGPPRKYYGITADGRRALADFTVEWRRFSAAVDTILSKGAHG